MLKKIKKWLGIDQIKKQVDDLEHFTKALHNLVHIGVDVHFKEPHMILIYTKLNGGQLRHIDANFDNLKDLEVFVKELKEKFKTNRDIWDLPQSLRPRSWRY